MVDQPDLLPTAAQQTPVLARRSGYLTDIDAYVLGQVAMRLGAGRATAADSIDPAVGLRLACRPGAAIRAGQPLCWVHHNGLEADRLAATLDEVGCSMPVGAAPPDPTPLVRDALGDAGGRPSAP